MSPDRSWSYTEDTGLPEKKLCGIVVFQTLPIRGYDACASEVPVY